MDGDAEKGLFPKGLYHGDRGVLEYLREKGYKDPLWYNEVLPSPIKFISSKGRQVLTDPKRILAHENHYKRLNGLSCLRMHLILLTSPSRLTVPGSGVVIPTSIYHLRSIPRPNDVLKIDFIDVPYELGQLPETRLDKNKAITQITTSIIRACQTGRDVSNGKHARHVAYVAEHLSNITHPATTPELIDRKKKWIIEVAEWMLPRKT
ncbi:hypothetical protein F4680DRAFT_464538 [Xylaria scruposa]|nr:hypothetical protein F4680DRAFT_464538 [Xylaria scruposa]